MTKQGDATPSEDGESYTVEKIIDHKIEKGKKMYFLKWKGYDSIHNTWEPEEHLECQDLLAQYWRRKKKSPYGAGVNLSSILHNVPARHRIRICNTVDTAVLPEEFTYTDDYVRGNGVPNPSNVVFPCDCLDGQCSTDCDCMNVPYYDENGRLCTDLQLPIYECSHLCDCPESCPNRTVQRGSTIDIDIFRTRDKGWGARTRRFIARGEFVCRYTGELLMSKDAYLRGNGSLTYLFDLDKEVPRTCDPPFTIDAKMFGNVSHFFNHSCGPNMGIWAVYINHRDARLHELAFFALKDIAPGEELTFDYSPDTGESPYHTSCKFTCRCGTPECRGSLF
ncbi:hypothetical protein GGI04_000052 [Coemansia thaxteri]|nr:hypothetical protein GGI04_000052 [Coemansia thaxteri]KAJ2473517.1 hypothetical protein GGI02_000804 [Coemansia sp. RSA 2322]